MGGCYSSDESQQITWVCGSFHHQLQISIKTESGGAEDTGGYLSCIPTSHLSLLSISIHPWRWSCCPTMLWTSLSQLSYWFLYYVELRSQQGGPSLLLFTPTLHTPFLFGQIFLQLFSKTCNPNLAVTQGIYNVIFCQPVIITDY